MPLFFICIHIVEEEQSWPWAKRWSGKSKLSFFLWSLILLSYEFSPASKTPPKVHTYRYTHLKLSFLLVSGQRLTAILIPSINDSKPKNWLSLRYLHFNLNLFVRYKNHLQLERGKGKKHCSRKKGKTERENKINFWKKVKQVLLFCQKIVPVTSQNQFWRQACSVVSEKWKETVYRSNQHEEGPHTYSHISTRLIQLLPFKKKRGETFKMAE